RGLGAAEVDDDVAALETLDGAVEHLADAVDVFVVDVLALGLAHSLVEHLLGRLGGDAAQALGRDRQVDLVAHLRVRLVVARLVGGPLGERILDRLDHLLDDEGVEVPGLAIEVRAHRLFDPVLLLGGGGHRILERADPAIEVDILLSRHLAQDLVQVDVRGLCLSHLHRFLASVSCSYSSMTSRAVCICSSRSVVRFSVPSSTSSTSAVSGRNPSSRATTVRLRTSGVPYVTRTCRPTNRS